MPSFELLSEALDYNPETGELKWKHRPTSHFCSQKKCDHWNRTWAGKRAGCQSFLPNGRKQYSQFMFTTRNEGKKLICVHHVVFAMCGETIPAGMYVDHKNGDIWDNRRDNLRLASALQNSWNSARHSNKTFDLPKNVFTRKNRPGYYARISINGKRIGLGQFPTPELASDAVRLAAEKHHGEFGNAGQ